MVRTYAGVETYIVINISGGLSSVLTQSSTLCDLIDQPRVQRHLLTISNFVAFSNFLAEPTFLPFYCAAPCSTVCGQYRDYGRRSLSIPVAAAGSKVAFYRKCELFVVLLRYRNLLKIQCMTMFPINVLLSTFDLFSRSPSPLQSCLFECEHVCVIALQSSVAMPVYPAASGQCLNCLKAPVFTLATVMFTSVSPVTRQPGSQTGDQTAG